MFPLQTPEEEAGAGKGRSPPCTGKANSECGPFEIACRTASVVRKAKVFFPQTKKWRLGEDKALPMAHARKGQSHRKHPPFNKTKHVTWPTDFSRRAPRSFHGERAVLPQTVLRTLNDHMQGMKSEPLPHTVHKS